MTPEGSLRSPLDPVLSKMNPVYNPTSCCCNICFNSILSLGFQSVLSIALTSKCLSEHEVCYHRVMNLCLDIFTAYQVDNKWSQYAGNVAHDVDESDTLCPHHSWQHFSCVLEPNVVRDVHAEATQNGKGSWWCSCKLNNTCSIVEKFYFFVGFKVLTSLTIAR